jgi:hypothetical protein
VSSIYDDDKKDEDGFLYVTYSGENTFGNLTSHICSLIGLSDKFSVVLISITLLSMLCTVVNKFEEPD